MNEHKSRHRTHTVKPANGVIGPLGHVVKPVPAPIPGDTVPAVAETPAVPVAAVEVV